MELNNPAARLLSILELGGSKDPSDNCRKVWEELLGVESGNKALLMGRMGKLMSLSTEIIECLNKIDGIKIERYLQWAGPLDKAFSNNDLNGVWGTFIQQINIHVLSYLTITSDYLSLKMPEPIIAGSDLDNILNNAKKLIDEVKDADLPEKTKEYMVKQLHKVCLSVEEYQITGAENVSDIVESTFGHGIFDSELRKDSTNNSITEKFWRYMMRTAMIVTLSVNAAQLPPIVQKMFPDTNFEKESSPITEPEQETERI